MTLIKQRLFGDWKSSIIAVVLAGILAALGFTGKVEWGTVQVWFVAVFGLLLSGDPETKEQKEATVTAAVEKALFTQSEKVKSAVVDGIIDCVKNNQLRIQ